MNPSRVAATSGELAQRRTVAFVGDDPLVLAAARVPDERESAFIGQGEDEPRLRIAEDAVARVGLVVGIGAMERLGVDPGGDGRLMNILQLECIAKVDESILLAVQLHSGADDAGSVKHGAVIGAVMVRRRIQDRFALRLIQFPVRDEPILGRPARRRRNPRHGQDGGGRAAAQQNRKCCIGDLVEETLPCQRQRQARAFSDRVRRLPRVATPTHVQAAAQETAPVARLLLVAHPRASLQ